MAKKWSESDNYFVGKSLSVYSVDLSLEPLEMVWEEHVKYDGPKGSKFTSFLSDNDFRVNRQGKAIVVVPKRNRKEEEEEEYNFFLLEKLYLLDPSGFSNAPSPMQEVKVLKSLLDETRADLAKKNAELDELHRKNLHWKSEQLLLTITAITESLNRVFVDSDLKPPASGDPKSVLRFLKKLRDLIRRKEECSSTFLVAANEILASISGAIYKSTGLSIGMETSSPILTPADLIKSLSTLREFMVDRFFIDGSVIVKAYGLMNEKDIPFIFHESKAGVAELHRKKMAKSMDDFDRTSIFCGYFNIPAVGKFKGVLTRVNVTLPDEIMVKLGHRPVLDEEGFWFVKANGEAIFEESSSPPESSSITEINPGNSGSRGNGRKRQNVLVASTRLLGRGVIGGGWVELLGILIRICLEAKNREEN